jgi:Ulp1 protease family, C-terminal catalytic domain
MISQDAPARLKKELDTVLALQADLDTSDKALQTARTMLEKDMASDDTLEALESLERGHDRLMNKVEALYSSLNVHDRFPELHGINLEFVRILLLARDLKMNVRKRAIASFFEWDKLDQAVGGVQQALGKIVLFC